jgi:hypothetical protein
MKDVCVICKKETSKGTKAPENQRKSYIDDGGQLCPSCYKKVYGNG